jgi:protein O-mannosyl-transferase
MSSVPEQWTLDGFLDHFQRVHATMQDHQFSWVIGAGASRSAGIPTGAELVDCWLRDIHRRECRDDKPLEEWATAERLGIDGFTYEDRAASYPAIYERRFRGFPAEGFAYLEHVMTGNAKSFGQSGLEDAQPIKVIEPGPGYSILAKIMETERHRVVITTNFDNLVADAMQVYTGTYPLVCGHEALAGFVNVAMRRPVVCKVHRDLFLAPFNDRRKLRLLHESWLATLRAMLGEYTPIVIGYGGNDDSLMDRLSSLEPSDINGRLLWCYYWGPDGKSEPSSRICDLVAELNGVLIPVPDFDRLLILLGARLGVEVLDQELERRQDERIKRYRDAVLALKTDDLPQMKQALRKTYQRAGWLWWQLRVDQHTDPTEKEAAYKEAIRNCPHSPELIGNFAIFMKNVRNYDEAEQLYRKAIEMDPNNARQTGNFANFMTDVRKNYDEAESLYRKAIHLDPRHANNTNSLATFMAHVRKNYDEAERLYRKAIELDPNNAYIACSFAIFIKNTRTNDDEAERLYRKAIELDPNNANYAGNFAIFVKNVRKNDDEAERLYRKAIELDPNNARQTGNFANFMTDVRKNYDEGERLYRKAIELDPDDAYNTGNFAGFLLSRREVDKASALIDKAIELNRGEAGQLLGEVLIYKATLEALGDTSNEQPLKELRELLRAEFPRAEWSFEPLFASVGNQLSPGTLAILQAFGEAVLDVNKAVVLDETLSAIRKKFAVGGKLRANRNRNKRASRRKLKSGN